MDWYLRGQATDDLIDAISQSDGQRLWRKAALHYCGGGAEGGIDDHVLQRHLRHYRAKGFKNKEAMLIKIASAGVWHGHRKFQENLCESDLCPRGRLRTETLRHRFWECPRNADLDSHTRKISDSLVRLAERDKETDIFFCRGLPPNKWFDTDPVPEEMPEHQLGDLRSWLAGGLFFSDGSGGENSSDPRIRRAGWGVVQMADLHPPGVLKIALWGPLPGPRQTVPRAELFAFTRFIEKIAELKVEADTELWVDCKYLTTTWGKGPAGFKPAACNADLWERVWQAYSQLRCRMAINRVWRSHVEDLHIALGLISPEHVVGNSYADEAARRGAKEHKISQDTKKSFQILDAQTWAAQSRMVEASLLAA